MSSLKSIVGATLSADYSKGASDTNAPKQQALLQWVAQAKQAIPQVREAVRLKVCGPLRQDLLLLANDLGNPSWRLLETLQERTSEERNISQ